MGTITFQVLEGFERGRVFADLPTPVTIGREEDNTIQLNDERVSRFHAKIQEDGGRVILTDLDSTNGTRINGHSVQMRVLQHGDQLSIGRSLLLYGSPTEIEQMLRSRRNGPVEAPGNGAASADPNAPGRRTVSAFDEEPIDDRPADDAPQDLFPQGPPALPVGLRMAETAQLSDVLAYVHDQLSLTIDSGVEAGQGPLAQMRLPPEAWQRILRLNMHLATYLRKLAEPGH